MLAAPTRPSSKAELACFVSIVPHFLVRFQFIHNVGEDPAAEIERGQATASSPQNQRLEPARDETGIGAAIGIR